MHTAISNYYGLKGKICFFINRFMVCKKPGQKVNALGTIISNISENCALTPAITSYHICL